MTKLAFALTSVVAFAACSSCATLPMGSSGSDADALAHKIEAWVNKDAWDKTGVVRFTFRDKHVHLWDKQRGFLVVTSGDVEAQLDLWDHGGFASKGGVELTGDDAKKALDDAWKYFCNDTFWLNPLAKLFDSGTTREVVTMDGKRGLKITYGSGGVTPGDSYVWFVDDDGRPTSVRMWVSVLPIKGIEFTWDGWVTLPTGAKVATNHASTGVDHAVFMNKVEGAVDAATLGVDDKFAKLVARRASPH
jgi:hypothetical protein